MKKSVSFQSLAMVLELFSLTFVWEEEYVWTLAHKVVCIVSCHVPSSDKTFQVLETAVGERQIVVSPFLLVRALDPSKLFYWNLG